MATGSLKPKEPITEFYREFFLHFCRFPEANNDSQILGCFYRFQSTANDLNREFTRNKQR